MSSNKTYLKYKKIMTRPKKKKPHHTHKVYFFFLLDIKHNLNFKLAMFIHGASDNLKQFFFFFWQKHHLGSQSIWSLHFDSSQFSPYYFQITVNLVPTVNLLTENAYMANGVHCWHT